MYQLKVELSLIQTGKSFIEKFSILRKEKTNLRRLKRVLPYNKDRAIRGLVLYI